jgi:hypothetical protein
MPGWTWEYVDEHMDLVRLGTLCAYWAKNPPVHVAFARFIDWKPSAKPAAAPAPSPPSNRPAPSSIR